MQAIHKFPINPYGLTNVRVKGPYTVLSVASQYQSLMAWVLLHDLESTDDYVIPFNVVYTGENLGECKPYDLFPWRFLSTHFDHRGLVLHVFVKDCQGHPIPITFK